MKILKKKNIKHTGFTLVEMMLLLVILSLIFASSATVITKKHKLKPRKAIHGKYICYLDKSDNLHEILFSGKTKLSDKTYTPEEQAAGAECRFSGPSNTSYLYVQILGGGGAGGNANFYEEKKETKSGKYISLFGDEAGDCGEKTSLSYCKHSNSSYYKFSKSDGITKAFIDGLFTDGDGKSLFSGNIYRKILNDYGVKLFSFDRGGGGASGVGYEFNIASTNYSTPDEPVYLCKCDFSTVYNEYRTFSSAAACATECFDPSLDEEKPGFLNDISTCTMNSNKTKEENSLACAEAYLKRKVKNVEKTCTGGLGGSGTVFTSELIPFDFEVKANVLGRNYNGGRNTIDWDVTASATTVWDALKNKGGKHYITDRAGTTFHLDKRNEAVELTPDPTALSAGIFQTCTEGEADCVKYADGKFYKVAEESSYTYYRYRENYALDKGRYTRIFTTNPTYDFSKDKYVTPDFTAYTQEKIDTEYSYLKSDGLYPYQVLSSCNPITLDNCSYEDAISGGNPYGVGLTTTAGTTYYRFQPNEILGGSTPLGKHGESILGTEIVFKDKGIFTGCPTKSSGSRGDTYYKSTTSNSNLFCLNNMGIYLSNPSYATRFNKKNTRSTPTKTNSYQICSNSGDSVTSDSLSNSLGILIQYVQNSIALSHGEHGRAGEVKSLFARSFGTDVIKLYPGKGGLAVPIDTDKTEGHKTARGNDGSPSSIIYNCQSDGSCDTIEAAGGFGGKSRIWESSRETALTGEKIYKLVNNMPGAIDEFLDKRSSYYTAAAPNNYKGEDSSFTETSKLLDLPNLYGINLSELGKGGDGGYVTYQCLLLPQYFQVVYNYGTEKISNFSKSNLPGATTEWEGYTKFTETEANAACAGHLSPDSEGKTYTETAGTDGLPGAIVIMW